MGGLRMNNFIPAAEFLTQSDKVKYKIIKWWEPQIGDLYCDINAYGLNDISCISKEERAFTISIDKQYNYFTPLLQMQQLINFIEDNDILIHCSLIAWIYYKNKNLSKPNYIKFGEEFNRLEALWQVAIQIIEGE